jgi:hypothetical protein
MIAATLAFFIRKLTIVGVRPVRTPTMFTAAGTDRTRRFVNVR